MINLKPPEGLVYIEVKRSRDFDELEADCKRAIRQIRENNYAWPYQRRKYTVLAYGDRVFGKGLQREGGEAVVLIGQGAGSARKRVQYPARFFDEF